MSRSRAGVVGFAVVIATALALTGCSNASTETGAASSSGRDEPASSGRVVTAETAAPKPPDGRQGYAAAADPVGLTGRRQVRAADLGLRVENVPAAAATVRAIAASAKGFVADERTGTDPGPTPVPMGRPEVTVSPTPKGEQSVLTLRVPERSLDRVMDQVSAIGSVLSRGQSSTDVTGQHVDVASRLRTQRESVDRVRALLGRATTIGQVVQVESELTRRQADLESLQAQLAALEDQTTLASLTVTLSPTESAVAATPGAFVAGLTDGWRALVASVGVLLTVVGAVLPFAVLLALIGVPVLALLRRRRAQPSA